MKTQQAVEALKNYVLDERAHQVLTLTFIGQSIIWTVAELEHKET